MIVLVPLELTEYDYEYNNDPRNTLHAAGPLAHRRGYSGRSLLTQVSPVALVFTTPALHALGLSAEPYQVSSVIQWQVVAGPPCSATPLLRPLVDSEPITQPSSSSSSSCPSPSLGCSCYGLQPALAPLSFVRWLTPSPSASPPRPILRPAPRRASAAAATGCSLPWCPYPSPGG